MIDYNSENNAYLDDSLNSFNIFDNNIPNFNLKIFFINYLI